jgi:ABC-type antimicrobial peptide transport system ATPase subunit
MSDAPDNDHGLGLKVHEDAYRELERELATVTEQRDRLAKALRELCETLLADKPRDITELLNKAGDALAVKGVGDE